MNQRSRLEPNDGEERYPVLNNFYRGKKVFLTGATGFVGGHLARRLLELGAHLRIFVRPSSDTEKVRVLAEKGAEVSLGDLGNRVSVLSSLEDAEYVFHIGALYRAAKFADEVYFRANLEGTRNILDASLKAGVKRVVYCSTTGVHSHIEHPPADESAPFHPTDVYQRSKAEAELLVQKYGNEHNLPYTIIRPAMIWGEGDTRFLKMFRGISQRKMPLVGDGSTWTHWIYIEDLADAFLLAPTTQESLNKVYIIAGDRPIRLKQVYESIAQAAGTKMLPYRIPIRPLQMLGTIVESICRPFGIEPPLYRRRVDFFIKNRAFITDRAKRDLGFSPRLSFEEEVQRIYRWYDRHGLLAEERTKISKA